MRRSLNVYILVVFGYEAIFSNNVSIFTGLFLRFFFYGFTIIHSHTTSCRSTIDVEELQEATEQEDLMVEREVKDDFWLGLLVSAHEGRQGPSLLEYFFSF